MTNSTDANYDVLNDTDIVSMFSPLIEPNQTTDVPIVYTEVTVLPSSSKFRFFLNELNGT